MFVQFAVYALVLSVCVCVCGGFFKLNRHLDNVRGHHGNECELKKSVLEKGVMWQVRGECLVLANKDKAGPYLALAGGTITAVFYDALAEASSFLLVLFVSEGVRHC